MRMDMIMSSICLRAWDAALRTAMGETGSVSSPSTTSISRSTVMPPSPHAMVLPSSNRWTYPVKACADEEKIIKRNMIGNIFRNII